MPRVLASAALLVLASCSTGNTSGAGGPATLDASRIFQGNLSIAGTVTLPPGGSTGGVQINVSGPKGGQVGPAGTASGETVAYAITGLVAGDYLVQVRVDHDGNGMLGEPGDLEGYFGGSAAAPVLDRSKAVKITLGAQSLVGQDFALGPIP